MRYRSLKHLSTFFILVEAKLDERADPAAALGRAVDNGILDPIAQRIYQAALVTVAQEGVKVAGRGEAKPHHHGILRCVKELVDVVCVEAALEANLRRIRNTGEWSRRAVGKGPLHVRDEFPRVVLMHAPRQGCSGVVSADRLVGWGLGHIDRARRGTENVFSTHPPLDLTAVAVSGDRQSDLQTGRYIAFPPVIHERIPLTLEETVTDVSGVAADVQLRTPDISAVWHIIQKSAVAATHVDGLGNCKIHRVLDLAARIARR